MIPPNETSYNPQNKPDLASQGQTLEPSEKEPEKPKRKLPVGKILVAAVVIVITFFAFGLIAYLITGQNKTQENQIVETQEKAPTPTPDATADWQTYEGGGFSFKYPDGWDTLKDSSIILRKAIYSINNSTIESDPIGGYDIVILEPISSKSKEEIVVGTIFEQWMENSIETKVNGYDALKISGSGGIASTVHSIGFAIEKDPSTSILIDAYTLNEDLKDDLESEMLEILSTFKFTDSASAIDTSGWKTYTNNKAGLRFDYPAGLGNIRTTESAGEIEQGENDIILVLSFDQSCTTDCTQEVNSIYSAWDLLGYFDMNAIGRDFSGFPGSGRPSATISDFKLIDESTVQFKGWSDINDYEIVEGKNTSGIISRDFDSQHDWTITRVIFKLNNDQFTSFNFMTLDEAGSSSRAEIMEAIAKTFELIN